MSIDSFVGFSPWVVTGLALLCGGAIGLERQLSGKPAGIRTSILICLGTAVFVHLGALLQSEGGDATRVVGQVVVGVGFLGGGAIINTRGTVKGLTSAAVVWVLAGIGSAIGIGQHLFAVWLTAVTVFVLVVVAWVERWIPVLLTGDHDHHGLEARLRFMHRERRRLDQNEDSEHRREE